MTKHEKFVNDSLTNIALSLTGSLMFRKRVKPMIGASAFRRLELIEEDLDDVINAFKYSINY